MFIYKHQGYELNSPFWHLIIIGFERKCIGHERNSYTYKHTCILVVYYDQNLKIHILNDNLATHTSYETRRIITLILISRNTYHGRSIWLLPFVYRSFKILGFCL